MWSSNRTVRAAGVVLALALLPVLGACSGLTPVYGTNQFTTGRIELAMAPTVVVRPGVPASIDVGDIGLKLTVKRSGD